MNSTANHRPIITWLLLIELLIIAIVAIGGITRLTDSGLSMVEWKPLLGTIPPLNETQWQETFAKYQQFPQYKIINHQMTLPAFKKIFLWEYLHRLLGRAIGLLFALPYLYFLLRRKLPKPLGRQCLIALLLGASQGLLGWWMVKSGLSDLPYVSHFRLAAHLLLAFTVFSYILWILLSLQQPHTTTPNNTPKKFRIAQHTLLLLTLLQITYGAFVAGLNAGYAYNTFPKMMGQWMPPGWTNWQPLWQSPLFHPGMVQWVHRTLAGLLLIGLSALSIYGTKIKLNKRPKALLHLSTTLLYIQCLLGISTLLLHVPIPLAILHQLTALLLLASMIALTYHLKKHP